MSETSAEFDWWFRTSYASVARAVYLVVGDRASAEELAQEAFAKMFQHWRTVGAYERPDAWVRRVAIRMAVKHVKREGLRRAKERLSQTGSSEAVTEIPDPDLARAVAELSPMQRAAVVLYYWQDLPVFEVARDLQVSESTVKQHLYRARARLAELLGEEVTGDVR